MLKQFFTFASVGAVGTTGHYVTLILLVQIFGIKPVIATTAGFIIGAVINYALNYRFTFQSSKRHTEAMLKFFLVASMGAAVNTGIMYFGTTFTNIHYIIVQLVATGFVVFITFLFNKCWTFAH